MAAFRARWKECVARAKGREEELRSGKEAVALRMEVARWLREEVAGVRRSLGYPDDDPKTGLMETWREEGVGEGKRRDDGSVLGPT